MNRPTIGPAILLICVANALGAEDSYLVVPIGALKTARTAVEKPEPRLGRERPSPRVVVTGESEAYFVHDTSFFSRDAAAKASIAVRGKAGGTVAGTLVIPPGEGTTADEGMESRRFQITMPSSGGPRDAFLQAKEAHYRMLTISGAPGASWFRRQMSEAFTARTGKQAAPDDGAERPMNTPAGRRLEMFSGARAISENLQLDRNLLPAEKDEPLVAVDSLQGVTVAPFDWSTLIKGTPASDDPLADTIPEDQHALFLSSPGTLAKLLEAIRSPALPILNAVDPRSQSRPIVDRYREQFGALFSAEGLNTLSPMTARVAITGSDPCYADGTDVAVLLQSVRAEKTSGLLREVERRLEQSATSAGVKLVRARFEGTEYMAVRSPQRNLSAYAAKVGPVVAVTNSMAQLRHLLETQQKGTRRLGKAPEFTFFRNRYPMNDGKSAGLLVVSDATIRRSVGPRWRIASWRRAQAAAILQSLTAAHWEEMIAGAATPRALATPYRAPMGASFAMTKDGPHSDQFGSPRFLTPIVELPIDQVTRGEADAYQRFRDNYQQNWRQFFDPIALCVTLDDKEVMADLSVMPLIAGSDYRRLIALVGKAKLAPFAGDRRPDALAQIITAIDTSAEEFQRGERFLSVLGARPFQWVGRSITLFADEDPFWEEWRKSPNREQFIEPQFHRLPVGLQVEVADPLKLALFLTSLRALIEQTAPGLTRFESRDHQGKTYVRIGATAAAGAQTGIQNPERLAIYYAIDASSFLISLNESVVRRFFDRRNKSVPPSAKSPFGPWLGEHLGFRLSPGGLTAFGALVEQDAEREIREQCFQNLPLLNDFRHRFPGQDPPRLFERFVGAPAGAAELGAYQWNEAWQTMESTRFGHPSQPRSGIQSGLFGAMSGFDFGITFEHDGLRARVVIGLPPGR